MDIRSVSDHLVGPAAFASVIFVLAQLRQNVNQEIREMIAEYNMRYLEVAARIPYEILVEDRSIESLPVEKQAGAKRVLYDYFLLCDEQLNLVNGRTFKGNNLLRRLSRLGTWIQIRDVRVWEQAEAEWIEGITDNFRKQAFGHVFTEVSTQLRSSSPKQYFSAIHDNVLNKMTN
jgi:hypothetical protein